MSNSYKLIQNKKNPKRCAKYAVSSKLNARKRRIFLNENIFIPPKKSYRTIIVYVTLNANYLKIERRKYSIQRSCSVPIT